MSIKIKDIAREAGVSHTPVSRALHNQPAIPSQTTWCIQVIAVQMGYRPSAMARGLKTSRSKTLGAILCVPPFRAEHSRSFKAYCLPITVINNQDAEDYQYSIYHGDVYGSCQVTGHLLALEHRRIIYLDPPLTTFHQPKFHLGAEAVRLMQRLLQSVVQGNGLP